MSVKTKIHLSRLEMELVNNASWILTKQRIIDKVYLLFGEILENYKRVSKEEINSHSLFEITKGGKISKGENYLGLPYVMLDYPAFFDKEKIFAIRTMFWWGNFFSITLHISGEESLSKMSFSDCFDYIKNSNFFVCVNDDQWHHHFEKDNYVHAHDIDKKTFAGIYSKNFLKISGKTDIRNFNNVQNFLEKTYRELIEFIKINFPAGEITL